jgi:hypothetical protein
MGSSSSRLNQLLVWAALLAAGFVLIRFQPTSGGNRPNQTASNQLGYTYFGPVRPAPGNPQLVRVEVLIRDAPEAEGLQVVNVEFNKTTIPLKPRDIYGIRGSASFQVKPGVYPLRWVVNRDQFAWPRTLKHEETVTVSPRDFWLQISIVGDTASID